VLPYEVGVLEQLVRLQLSNNQLSTFPVFLGKLHKLEVLDLSQNRLMSISYHLAVSLPFLKRLQVLRLQHNQIATALPFQMSALESLTELDLSHNKLVRIQPFPAPQIADNTDATRTRTQPHAHHARHTRHRTTN
jgi:Leucine-rich repeat (LRR) protein